jgi:hypothetical protein
MKARPVNYAVVLSAFIAGFFLYGIGRTMQETGNVTFRGLLSGMFPDICIPLVLAIPAVI